MIMPKDHSAREKALEARQAAIQYRRTNDRPVRPMPTPIGDACALYMGVADAVYQAQIQAYSNGDTAAGDFYGAYYDALTFQASTCYVLHDLLS
jgi:hypothetical protein